MRTTVTLDPDTAALVQRRMRERGISFKQAINEAIRQGLGPLADAEPFRTQARAMGLPSVPLDRALRVGGEIEDEETLRKMRLGT